MNPLSQQLPNGASKFGGSIFQNVINGINTGLAAYSQIQAGQSQGGGGASGGGCGTGLMLGQGAIAGCIDSLASQYHTIEAQGNTAATLQAAQAILAVLNNPQLFAPQSDAYLTSAKGVMSHAIQVLQTAIASGAGATNTADIPVATNSNGQLVNAAGQVISTTAAKDTILGIPLSYIAVGLSAVGLLVVLRKK